MGNKPISKYNIDFIPEVIIKKYSSKYDKEFTKFETEYNFFQYLDIKDFQQLLYNFTCTEQEKIEKRNKEYNFEVSETMFSVFVSKKIINHFLIYPHIANDEKKINVVKAFLNNVFTILRKNTSQYNKLNGKKTENKTIKKLCLLSYGFVFCKEDHFNKIQFLFYLLSDEDEMLKFSDDLIEFLFFVFLIPSNVLIFSIYSLGKEFEEFAIEDEYFAEIYNACELKDAKFLAKKVVEELFKEKSQLDFDDFYKKIILEDWVFSTHGIRKKLEDNNQD